MSLTTEQVREFFDRPAYLERGRFLIDVRAILVRDLIGPTAHARILDLGCGDGSISVPLLTLVNELTLVDLSPRMLELASARIPNRLRSRTQVVNAALTDFPPAGTYDLVLCIGVLAHVNNIDAAVAKIAQCLEPGGSAIVEFTPVPNPWRRLLFPYYWIREIHRGTPMGYQTNKVPMPQILQTFKHHGLDLVRVKRHFFPLPTMAWWPQRWLYRYALSAAKSRLGSIIGTEHIMLFAKPDKKTNSGV
jgi:ubiquinone/menaquinone biosynthesis C-methylase UbiE